MRLYRVLKIIFITAIAYSIIWITEFPCPFRVITGYPCPGCGSAHALNDIVHGRFAMSFIRNPLAIPLVCVLLYALYKELFPAAEKDERNKEKILVKATVIIFILYVLRMIFHSLR